MQTKTKMKVLKVYGDDDFGANSFNNQHAGVSIDLVIANPDNYLPTEDNDEYEQWNLEVIDFDCNVNEEFLSFVRDDMIDYDHSKHITFYVEGETVKL
jgi:hypothetical protein